MKTVVIGTAGHIDHGKSALVRALTGIDPDRLKEEQARGITIDLGFAHLTGDDVQLAFVDVPGHERFVRNMLAGAGGIDAVLLVVAVSESVMPQTREHFDICRLLGIDRGAIALTKTDLGDPDMAAAATSEIRALVAGSFLENAPIVPVSARTGDGLERLRQGLAALAGQPPRLHRAGVARLPIDRVFTVRGFGAVVTGTLVSGTIAVGDTLTVLPQGDAVRVRGVQVHGQSAAAAAAPQRVAVNVAGIDAAALHRGMTLATAGALATTRRADVRLQLLATARPLAHGARVRAHHGTADVFARVSLAAVRHRSGESWNPASAGDAEVIVPPGGEAFARLRFDRPLVLTRGDRLVLRTASPVATIGGAVVLDPEPAAGGVRRAAALEQFRRIDDDCDVAGVVAAFLTFAGGRGLDAGSLVRRAGLDRDQAGAVLDTLAATGQALIVAARAFSSAAVDEIRARITAEIARFHTAHPTEAGMPRETLRARMVTRASADLVDALLADLTARGAASGAGRVALASHRPAVTGDADLRESVELRLQRAALAPPEPAALAAELSVPESDVLQAIQGLTREGRLVRVGGMAFHRDALAALKADVLGLRAGQAPDAPITLDVAAFKARHNLTRKHAIPLLEWLDRERVTRRIGDVRVVR